MNNIDFQLFYYFEQWFYINFNTLKTIRIIITSAILLYAIWALSAQTTPLQNNNGEATSNPPEGGNTHVGSGGDIQNIGATNVRISITHCVIILAGVDFLPIKNNLA